MSVKRRVYVASSWRNAMQPGVVAALRLWDHEVYDFRHSGPDDCGFSWDQIDPNWQAWSARQYVDKVRKDPLARSGFDLDRAALDWCDTCVLVLPSGRSAHLEAGYAAGQGKRVLVYITDGCFEPELMYLLCSGFVDSLFSLRAALAQPDPDLSCLGWDR